MPHTETVPAETNTAAATPQKLTKEQAIIVSGYTGFLICQFPDLHADIERRLGRPVFTHELAYMQLSELYKTDFIKLAP
jgi:hypothetical protein